MWAGDGQCFGVVHGLSTRPIGAHRSAGIVHPSIEYRRCGAWTTPVRAKGGNSCGDQRLQDDVTVPVGGRLRPSTHRQQRPHVDTAERLQIVFRAALKYVDAQKHGRRPVAVEERIEGPAVVRGDGFVVPYAFIGVTLRRIAFQLD